MKQLLRRAQISLPDDVEVMANEERQGLSGARNTGLKQPEGAVVAFLDDDAEADPGWLEELLKPYDCAVCQWASGAVPWPSGLESARLDANRVRLGGRLQLHRPAENDRSRS